MNIALIVIDTLRYDYIGANGNTWIETPNIDRFAAQAWAFDRAFCASFPTIPYRTDVITGQYGGPFHPWQPLRHERQTLPSTLAERGYATQLIHDTPHLVNGGHNFDWPFHAWTFIRGAEVDRDWIDDSAAWPDNWCHQPMFACLGENAARKGLLQTYARANRNRKKLEDWN
ncbi:MAG: sulfatase-like hydrolase/transferase, partial [Gemmatimonadetes bacterium]|nr:sulfatase-like hydrolase/transferase [Gemmatimonadota bacterium]